MKISKVRVYGLNESVCASKYPKSVNIDDLNDDITEVVRNLGRCEVGSGHDNFLNGIIVQFDLTFSLKAWPQAQRYHFFEFVSSQSLMHRVTKFNVRAQCNKYVTENSIKEVERLVAVYNADPSKENYLTLLYNIPTGFELTARMSTNYRQLKTMLLQREHHMLPDWDGFCKWVLTLPYFVSLCFPDRLKESYVQA